MIHQFIVVIVASCPSLINVFSALVTFSMFLWIEKSFAFRSHNLQPFTVCQNQAYNYTHCENVISIVKKIDEIFSRSLSSRVHQNTFIYACYDFARVEMRVVQKTTRARAWKVHTRVSPLTKLLNDVTLAQVPRLSPDLSTAALLLLSLLFSF